MWINTRTLTTDEHRWTRILDNEGTTRRVDKWGTEGIEGTQRTEGINHEADAECRSRNRLGIRPRVWPEDASLRES